MAVRCQHPQGSQGLRRTTASRVPLLHRAEIGCMQDRGAGRGGLLMTSELYVIGGRVKAEAALAKGQTGGTAQALREAGSAFRLSARCRHTCEAGLQVSGELRPSCEVPSGFLADFLRLLPPQLLDRHHRRAFSSPALMWFNIVGFRDYAIRRRSAAVQRGRGGDEGMTARQRWRCCRISCGRMTSYRARRGRSGG